MPDTRFISSLSVEKNPAKNEGNILIKTFARIVKEKAMQRALMQYKNPRNYDLVYEALKLEHREDLIGNDSKCLIRKKK